MQVGKAQTGQLPKNQSSVRTPEVLAVVSEVENTIGDMEDALAGVINRCSDVVRHEAGDPAAEEARASSCVPLAERLLCVNDRLRSTVIKLRYLNEIIEL